MQQDGCSSKTFEVMLYLVRDQAHFSISDMTKIIMLVIVTRVAFRSPLVRLCLKMILTLEIFDENFG